MVSFRREAHFCGILSGIVSGLVWYCLVVQSQDMTKLECGSYHAWRLKRDLASPLGRFFGSVAWPICEEIFYRGLPKWLSTYISSEKGFEYLEQYVYYVSLGLSVSFFYYIHDQNEKVSGVALSLLYSAMVENNQGSLWQNTISHIVHNTLSINDVVAQLSQCKPSF